jgi:hypothetical protein
VPNLITDRGIWLARLFVGGNVRRLMYQTLIWAAVLGDQACSLVAPGNTKNPKGLADPLIDGVGRDLELCRDFLRRQELVDEPQAVDLARGKPGHSLGHYVSRARIEAVTRRIMRSARIVQGNTHPAQHAATPEPESRR